MNRASETLLHSVPAPPKRRLTYDDLVAELPQTTQPSELWDGELIMSPAPSFYHQEIAFRFHRVLFDWVAARNLGKVVGAPVDMVLSPHCTVQPDVAFISAARLGIVERAIMGSADLVAEVVSVEGRGRDRIEKRDLYQKHRVNEYWIIDPEAGSVEVLQLEGAVYRMIAEARPGEKAQSQLLPGFDVSVDYLFHG